MPTPERRIGQAGGATPPRRADHCTDANAPWKGPTSGPAQPPAARDARLGGVDEVARSVSAEIMGDARYATNVPDWCQQRIGTAEQWSACGRPPAVGALVAGWGDPRRRRLEQSDDGRPSERFLSDDCSGASSCLPSGRACAARTGPCQRPMDRCLGSPHRCAAPRRRRGVRRRPRPRSPPIGNCRRSVSGRRSGTPSVPVAVRHFVGMPLSITGVGWMECAAGKVVARGAVPGRTSSGGSDGFALHCEGCF